MAVKTKMVKTTKPTQEKTEDVNVTKDVEVVEETKETKVKKSFKADDLIPCRSITGGRLFMTGIRTGITYEWIARDEVVEIEYQDLSAAVRSHASFVFKPNFIIEDDDFINEFPTLVNFYADLYQDDYEQILNMSDVSAMARIVENLPEGAKESLKGIAATWIKDGRLDSVAKIKTLDSIFGTKLMMTTELFDD